MNVLATWLREFADICSDMKPVGQWPGDGAATKLREAAAALATLTQQQGGEQEAVEVVGYWVPNARVMQDGSYDDGPGYLVLADEASEHEREHGAPLVNAIALRTKQPAASEGDVAEKEFFSREFYEEAHAGKVAWPDGTYSPQANTSKQAVADVVWAQSVLARGNWREVYIGHRCMRLEVSYEYGAWERLMLAVDSITTPPRHPADGGMAMQWPRGVLNRDKTLELLISHNEWRRGKEGPQTDPRLLGLALEATIAAIQAGSP